MIGFLRRQTWVDSILVVVALACLTAPAIQYPLSTTFPIGGDASVHIRTVQHMASRPLSTMYAITRSWYPVSYALFSINAFIPFVSWTDLYPWWMALGQILTGLSIGLLLFRISGIRAAAIGVALWGMTPIVLTSFFEDATMAQLWSLPWLALFFERAAAKSPKGMVIYFFLSAFSHPITGLIILITVIVTSPQLWIGRPHLDAKEQALRKIYSATAIAATILAIGIFATRYSIFSLKFGPESSRYIPELFHGFFLPWIIASIYGWYCIISPYKKQLISITSLASFFFVSILVGANDQLNIGFWTNRLNAYVTICIVIGASVGLSRMIEMVRPTWVGALCMSILLLARTGSVVHDNQNIYKRNESHTVSTRISYDELEAIAWMKEHLPLSANITSTTATRHYEWIPVLSGLAWNTGPSPYTFIVYFKRQEKIPEHILEQPEHYHLEYENKGAVIFLIKPV